MKFLTFKQTPDSPCQIGILDKSGQKIIPLSDLGIPIDCMQKLVESMDDSLFSKLKDAFENKTGMFELSTVVQLAPIPHPAREIICLGINYLDHAEESARFKKELFEGKREEAVYFGKRVNMAVPNGGKIPLHANVTQKLDYEAELGVIISKDARFVKREDAFDYVFGYTVINDVSARDLQLKHKQWYFGKSLEDSAPMGPWIVSKDEFAIPPVLEISSYVNGELRQKSSTGLLIFDVAYVIEELSQGMTLKAGSILSMGTPAGVGMGFQPPKFLKNGDVVECRIEGIGSLINVVEG